MFGFVSIKKFEKIKQEFNDRINQLEAEVESINRKEILIDLIKELKQGLICQVLPANDWNWLEVTLDCFFKYKEMKWIIDGYKKNKEYHYSFYDYNLNMEHVSNSDNTIYKLTIID